MCELQCWWWLGSGARNVACRWHAHTTVNTKHQVLHDFVFHRVDDVTKHA